MASLNALPLAPGIRARFVENVNGLTMHLLEAGYEQAGRPCVLLLHGFPELAYSWRKVMLPLASAGFHVIAPDQRGYGRTTGWDDAYDGDLNAFRILNVVKDALALVFALGHRSVAAVVGHDFGSPVAACCAILQPRVFRSVVLMSAPVGGVPVRNARVHEDLAALGRKHYQWYYSTREADANMRRIYVDSVVFQQSVLALAVEVCGVDNVLYGSDYPHTIGDMVGCLARVDALPSQTRDKVRGSNAQRIFKL